VHHLGAVDPAVLERYLGPHAQALVAMARGVDPRAVSPGEPAKSVGAENTFHDDLVDEAPIRAELMDLVQEVAFRLRRKGLYARTVTLKIRYKGFETVTRSRTLDAATDDDGALADLVTELWRTHAEHGRPVRLVGVSLSQLTPVAQLSWMDAEAVEEKRSLNKALDGLRDRHGLWVVTRGSHLGRSGG
jgi:DNA polymerase-4